MEMKNPYIIFVIKHDKGIFIIYGQYGGYYVVIYYY